MSKYIYLRISHSDEEIINPLSHELEAAGHKVWLGQDAGNAQQRRQTEFAIERSDAFILGLSPEAVVEDGVVQELAVAQAANRPIFVIQLRPVTLIDEWMKDLAGRPLVDFSDDFDAGLQELLALLAGEEGGAGAEELAESALGGEYLGEVPALPGEEELWSAAGYYWFKKWKTLVRVLVTQTDRRLIFFWDSRDIWKWKPREADELEETFPLAIPLEEITNVGQVYRPKTLLVFTAAKPYVEIEAGEGHLHRFSLQTDFEALIDTLRATISG